MEIILQEFFRLAIDAMAKNSLRCVAIACRTQELNKVPKEQEDLDKWDLPEDDLTLLAIVGIKDPCRPGVREAVRTCTSAGVKVDPTKTPEALLWIQKRYRKREKRSTTEMSPDANYSVSKLRR